MLAPSPPAFSHITSGSVAGPLDPEALRVATEPVADAVRAGVLPGAVVAVADSSGVASVQVIVGPRTPRLRVESIFFLASVTKPIVASAVLGLVDRGLIDLDEPVMRYIPEFAGPGKDRVTTRQVLTHTGGIADMDVDMLRRERPSAARLTQLVYDSDLTFDPGSRYEYCSSSFYLLAELLTRAHGTSFPEALRRELTGPLGMLDTTFDPRYARSRIVVVEGVPLRNFIVRELTLRFLSRATLPGGGMWGTASDLIRLGSALLRSWRGEPGFLSQAAVLEMTREQTTGVLEISADGATRDPHYALGWGKPRVDGGMPSVVPLPSDPEGDCPLPSVPASASAFTHGGATGTRLWVDPERDLVFVFLTNLWGASDVPMFSTLAEVYRRLTP